MKVRRRARSPRRSAGGAVTERGAETTVVSRALQSASAVLRPVGWSSTVILVTSRLPGGERLTPREEP